MTATVLQLPVRGAESALGTSVMVTEWNGGRAAALMSAYRYSIEKFASRLGVATRTVRRWRNDPLRVLSPNSAAMLDVLLSRADAGTLARFVEFTGIAPVATSSRDETDLREQVAELAVQVQALTALLARMVGDGYALTARHHTAEAVSA